MKNFVVIVVLALCAGPALAAYTVDLGSSEPYAMADWSSINPDSIGGGWGGFGSGGDNYTSPTTASFDKKCRTIWGQNDSRIATITFPTAIDSVEIRHLDGLALDCAGGGGDDFDVYVDYVYWGSYVSNPATNEYWVETTFSGTAGQVLMLIATDPAWSAQSTWGQVGIDRVVAVPEPVTIVLLGLGGLM
ncbi:MAG: hypothetical protein JXN61_15075, partial [Sedimentisphaerales bacterium]|nr:hypothetical protein [Sedimentisphaerales bacterium]